MAKPKRSNGLGELLATRTAALVETVERDRHAPDEAALAELERLVRLAALHKPRRRVDWLTIGAVVTVFVLVSIAYCVRRGSTSVSAEVAASELGFALGSTQPVIAGDRLSYLSIRGLDSVILPVAPGRTETIRARSLVLRPDSAPGVRATLDLAAVDLPLGTLVRIRATGHAGRYAWDLDHPDAGSRKMEHQVSISGAVVAQASGRSIPMRHEVGALLTVYSSSPVVIITGYADTVSRVLPPIRAAHRLAFDRTFKFQEIERAVSTIRSGTLSFDDLNGKEMKLGPGQTLRLRRADVEVPYLALANDQIRMRFSGDVAGMRTGARDRRNLMPRWLEYLRIHPAVVLISSVGFTLLGYVLGALGWWRQRK